MNILQAERRAQVDGFDSTEFIAHFPNGARRCRWIDAYLGLFTVEGIDGFVTADEVDREIPDLEVTQPA